MRIVRAGVLLLAAAPCLPACSDAADPAPAREALDTGSTREPLLACSGATNEHVMAINANADAFEDLVDVYEDFYGNVTAGLWLAKGDGTFTHAASQSFGAWSSMPSAQWFVLDADGDGMQDLVAIWNSGGAISTAFLGTGAGFYRAGSTYLGGWNTYPNEQWFVANVDGDRKQDLVDVWNNNGHAWAATYLGSTNGYFNGTSNVDLGGWNQPDQQRWLIADVNHDGRQDLVGIWDNNGQDFAATYLSNGSGFAGASNAFLGGWAASPYQQWFVGDVNGDGDQDIIDVWDNNGQAWVAAYFSNGSGFSASGAGTNVLLGGWNAPPDQQWYVADVNGDRKADLVGIWNNYGTAYAATYVSNGSTFVGTSNNALDRWDSVQSWAPMDVTGDHRQDLVEIYNGASSGFLMSIPSNGTGYAGSTRTWTCNIP